MFVLGVKTKPTLIKQHRVSHALLECPLDMYESAVTRYTSNVGLRSYSIDATGTSMTSVNDVIPGMYRVVFVDMVGPLKIVLKNQMFFFFCYQSNGSREARRSSIVRENRFTRERTSRAIFANFQSKFCQKIVREFRRLIQYRF